MKIEDNRVVSIHYTLTNDDGDELDSSTDDEPLAYLHGADNLIPGLERELTGKAAGDALQVTLQPEDAYGVYDPDLVQVVPRDAFDDEEIEPGMEFEAEGDDGDELLVVITEINGDEVTINGNHPLAGQTLHFQVTVHDVREPTEEEITHGHAH